MNNDSMCEAFLKSDAGGKIPLWQLVEEQDDNHDSIHDDNEWFGYEAAADHYQDLGNPYETYEAPRAPLAGASGPPCPPEQSPTPRSSSWGPLELLEGSLVAPPPAFPLSISKLLGHACMRIVHVLLFFFLCYAAGCDLCHMCCCYRRCCG